MNDILLESGDRSVPQSENTTASMESLLGQVADEFTQRLNRGEQPDIEEYAARYPRIATLLRQVLPALQLLRVPDTGQGIGGTLGDFRILREVGRGGMGVVYEAEQISLGRQVALKVLPFATTLDAKQLQRFKNEAHAAAHLHHNNIVPVYATGCERGVHFYAMQFVEGQTLAALIADLRHQSGLAQRRQAANDHLAPLRLGASEERQAATQDYQPADAPAKSTIEARGPADDTSPTGPRSSILDSPSSFFRMVAHLGIQAAEALEHAHQMGVIHRDIKPANLMIEQIPSPFSGEPGCVSARSRGEGARSPLATWGRGDGGEGGAPLTTHHSLRLWITDFGLAHCQGGCELTMSGDLLGTLRYMSPEQALAKRVVVDERTDIYSLGATLYELLTLEPAFPGTDRQEIFRRIAFDDPKPPRRLNKAIPVELETIVLKAVEKNPTDRFRTAREFADDLHRYLEDKPIRARRPTLRQRATKWAKRHRPVVLTSLASVTLLLIALAIGGSTAAIWKDHQLNLTQQAERDATRRLYASLVAQTSASRLSRHFGQRFESLKVLAEAVQIARDLNVPEENFLELRNEAIACLALPDLRVVEGEKAWEVGKDRIDFDGDLERYVRVDQQGNVSARRLTDNVEIYHFASGMGAALPQVAQDGRFLALSASWETAIWSLTGPEPVLVLRVPTPQGSKIAFSPDSRRLAIFRPTGSLHLYELPSARLLMELMVDPSAHCLAFNPKKAQLAVGCQLRVQIFDLENGQLTADLRAFGWEISWNPDGKTLASCHHVTISLWDVPTRKEIAQLACKRGVSNLAFSHAGDLLASIGWEGMLQLWDPRTGQELVSTMEVRPSWDNNLFLRFSRDDRLLGPSVQDGKLRFWEIHANREYRTLVLDRALGAGRYQSSAISPDGRLLAVGMEEGFGLWGLNTGHFLRFVPALAPAPGGWYLVSFESSGALLTGGDVRGGCNNAGVFRWPVHVDAQSLDLRRFGPPEKIGVPASTPHQIAATWNESVMAIARARGAFALDADRPNLLPNWLVVPRPHIGTGLIIALSADGQWIAAGTDTTGFNYEQLMVWDAKSGMLVKDLGLCPFNDLGPPGSHLAFSPDSQWLSNGGGSARSTVRVWQVGSWEERAHSDAPFSPVAFSPDSQMLAFVAGSGAIRLVAPGTGQEYARLQEPNRNQPWSICFSPDGAQLVTINRNWEPMHVWNLRAIREQLASMGLDWDLPAYPPAAKNKELKPLKVEVDLGDLMDGDKYSLIIALFPFHAEAYYQRGLAYARFFHWEKALNDFTMAAALRPDHADTYYQRGLMHFRLGVAGGWWTPREWWNPRASFDTAHLQKAVADFSRAIELRPKYVEAYAGRGEVYAAAHQWDKAVADFSQALESMGGDANLWFYRGIAYSNLARWQKAVLDFSKTIELDPDWYEPWRGRANAYYWQREWQKAVADYSKALELAPWQLNHWLGRGSTHAALGKWQEAIADFDRAIAIRPRYLEAYVERGGTYCTMNNWEKGQADLSKAMQLAPDRPEYAHHIALARLASGDIAGYRSACAAMLQHLGQADKPQEAYWVAWTLTLGPEAVKDWDGPVKLAEGTLQSDAKNHNYSQTVGAILYRASRFTEAVERLEQTSDWEQSPNKPAVFSPAYSWFFLAMAHSRLGHAREAGQWLDKASKWAEQELQEQHGCPWNRRLTLQILRRQAEALVKGTAEGQPAARKEKPEDKAPNP